MNKKIRILHIDDNLHGSYIVKKILQKESKQFEVVETDNRNEFYLHLTKSDFDIILSDHNILGLEGFKVLEEVKKMKPSTPIIVVTGSGSEEIAVEAMRLGVSDYVIKSDKFIQSLSPAIKKVIESRNIQVEYELNLIELRKSEERYRQLFDKSMDGVLLTSPDGEILNVNDATCRIFERTAEEITQIGRNGILDATDPRLAEGLEERSRTGFFAGELNGLRKDGTPFPIEISSSLFTDSEGNQRTSMIIRDISGRKESEKLLRASETRYRTLFESAKDGILILNAGTGMIVDVNPFLINLLGYSKEELKGKKIWEIGAFSDIIASGEKFLELQVKKYILYDDLPLKTRDGRLISVEFVSNVYKANHKNVIQCNIRDITLRKESELILNRNRLQIESQNIEYLKLNKELIALNKELILSKDKAEENDRLKTAFLQNLSHEILTPMNGILGFSDLLKDPTLSGEKQQEYIRVIEQSGKRMVNIISDLINISKIETGQVLLSIQETNVNQMLKYLYEFFKPEAEERGLNLNYKTEVPEEFSKIETDKTKLTQVLSNLLYNALKFTKTGSISFGYLLKGNMLEFYVQDTGIGIEPEMYEIIFERFRQLDNSISRSFEGSGLGLSISKAFVNKMGGRIWLKSKPGKGTTFYFTVPHNLEKISRLGKIKEAGLIT